MLEDPATIAPLACEQRVEASISSAVVDHAQIPITGTIDRLDDSDGLVVIDYKTGRSPPARFREGIWFQLEVYALLLHEKGRNVAKLRLTRMGSHLLVEAFGMFGMFGMKRSLSRRPPPWCDGS